MENIPLRPSPIQISKEEIEIINDIRRIDFGKITLTIQNGTVICKEVTTITKICKNKNNGGSGAGCDKLRKREEYLTTLLISFLPVIEMFTGG